MSVLDEKPNFDSDYDDDEDNILNEENLNEESSSEYSDDDFNDNENDENDDDENDDDDDLSDQELSQDEYSDNSSEFDSDDEYRIESKEDRSKKTQQKKVFLVEDNKVIKKIKQKDLTKIKTTQKEERISLPILYDYERALILGHRANQIMNGAQIMINLHPDELNKLDSFKIAERELNEKLLPFKILRKIRPDIREIWELSELDISKAIN